MGTKNKSATSVRDTREVSKDKQHSSQASPSTDVLKNRKSESRAHDGIDCPSDSSSADSEVLPPSRTRRTIHIPSKSSTNNCSHILSRSSTTPVSGARQRMRDNWQKTSIDSQNYEIELLNKRIKELETANEEEMRLKAEEFERWITQKENSLETEKNMRKDVEQNLEQAQVDIVGLQKQLEQQQQSYKNLEEILVEKHNTNHQLTNEKKDVERSLANAKEEIEDSNKIVARKDDEIKDVKKQYEDQVDQVNDLESTISEKDDKIKELHQSKEWLKNDHDKQLARLQKQLEFNKDKGTKLNDEKKHKIKELKEANSELKNKNEQISKLSKENDELALEIAKQKSTLEESVARSERNKLEDVSNSADHESQLKKNMQRCEDLEKQNKSLLDSLDRLQKIMEGHITVIEDKNKTIGELTSKYEDSENNLDQALQTLNDLKDAEKHRKDSQKQVKQLQTTLREWENRQFTNVKLISGFEKKNAELEKKVKNFEENNTGSEELLYEYSSKIKKLEKETKTLKEKGDKSDKELAETNSRLSSRAEEVFSLKAKTSTLEVRIRELEREVRKGQTMPDAEVKQLVTQIENKDLELKHLRKALENLKLQLKRTSDHYQNELAAAKKTSDQFEMDYSKALQKVEEFKKILNDAEQSILNKDNQLNCYKDAINDENIADLKHLLQESKNQTELAKAGKVVDSLSNAVMKISTGIFYDLNERFLVKSEPVDDVEESLGINDTGISNAVSANDGVTKKQPLSPVKKMSQVSTEKQIILNVPSMSDMVVSATEKNNIIDESTDTLSIRGITTVKQEPGMASSTITTRLSSQAALAGGLHSSNSSQPPTQPALYPNTTTQVSNFNPSPQPNTFVVSRISNPYVLSSPTLNQQTSSSAAKAIQAIKHPIPQQGLFQTNPNQQPQVQGLVESTFSMHTLPIINNKMRKHDIDIENDVDDIGAKDDTTESEESDTGLDDFFPQNDPMSGLSFAPKSEVTFSDIHQKGQKASNPKPSTSMNNFKRSPVSKLEDFTGKYAADEEESYTCGICNQFDPPLQPERTKDQSVTRYTTEWVGCDCERWFHKPCTKMKKFMKSFSCKSVKMKCLPKLPLVNDENVTYSH